MVVGASNQWIVVAARVDVRTMTDTRKWMEGEVVQSSDSEHGQHLKRPAIPSGGEATEDRSDEG